MPELPRHSLRGWHDARSASAVVLCSACPGRMVILKRCKATAAGLMPCAPQSVSSCTPCGKCLHCHGHANARVCSIRVAAAASAKQAALPVPARETPRPRGALESCAPQLVSCCAPCGMSFTATATQTRESARSEQRQQHRASKPRRFHKLERCHDCQWRRREPLACWQRRPSGNVFRFTASLNASLNL